MTLDPGDLNMARQLKHPSHSRKQVRESQPWDLLHDGSNGSTGLSCGYFPRPRILVEIDTLSHWPDPHTGSLFCVIKSIMEKKVKESLDLSPISPLRKQIEYYTTSLEKLRNQCHCQKPERYRGVDSYYIHIHGSVYLDQRS